MIISLFVTFGPCPVSVLPVILDVMGHLESIAVIAGVVIALIGFLLTMATLLGGNYKVARNAKIIADYKSGYDAIKAKSEGQEQQIEELQRENSEKDDKIAELQREIADLQGRMSSLQDIVTGKSAVEELAAQLNRLAESMNARAGEALAQIATMRGEVQAAHGQILAAVQSGDKRDN